MLDHHLPIQEQARQQRIKEEEEKKLKEAEKAKEEAEKAEKGNKHFRFFDLFVLDGEKETSEPQLETMEAKQKETPSEEKSDQENPIQGMISGPVFGLM